MGFDANLLTFDNGMATFSLSGELNTSTLRFLKDSVEKLSGLTSLVLDMTHLKSISDTGWNYLLFTKQRAGADFKVTLRGLSPEIKTSLVEAELDEEFITQA